MNKKELWNLYFKQYPLSTIQDFIKFLYQSTLGSAHLIQSVEDNYAYLLKEYESIQHDSNHILYERIHDYIDSMDAILCPRASTPYNCGIVTMNNNLHINITHDDYNEDLIFDFEKELNHLNIQFSKFDYQERLNYC